jgi:hypothetical protein
VCLLNTHIPYGSGSQQSFALQQTPKVGSGYLPDCRENLFFSAGGSDEILIGPLTFVHAPLFQLGNRAPLLFRRSAAACRAAAGLPARPAPLQLRAFFVYSNRCYFMFYL